MAQVDTIRVTKLRLALPDDPDALAVVREEVERATGFTARPVLQEVDRSDLVVEVKLEDSNSADPSHIAVAVERSRCDLEVLSTWSEPQLSNPTRTAHQTVLRSAGYPIPDVAIRAIKDDVPTAQWLPRPERGITSDRSYWYLAVPATRADGSSVIGIQSRRGYSYRFSAQEAVAALKGLGA